MTIGKPLGNREFQVLTLTAEGLEMTEIAAALYISPHTVKTHRLKILTKLGAHNAAHAVHLAYQAGLLGDAR